ncbi:MAG: rhomboid family intramembrane serine protease [Alphaproteobacteria bacterium]|nr:rhomboid family intramembrane serine protease [Alphaproteobacteria bacterium]
MATTLQKRGQTALVRVKENAGMLATVVGGTWLTHLATVLTGGWLLSFGIVPRSLPGLVGILFAPFLHGSFAHLLANTIAFVPLSILLLMRGKRDFYAVSAAGIVGSGLGAWLFGAPGTVTIGASGVLFAWLGFLMARGLVERSVGAVLATVAVTWGMGGMVWGVLPLTAGVSWQAHLFGFLTGLVVAWRMRVRS